MRVWACVLLAASAGCLGADVGGNGDLTDEVSAVRYRACYEHIGRFPIEAADLAAFLPAEFSPQAFPGDVSGRTGVVIVLTLACEDAEVGDVEREADVLDLWLGAPVDPPEALRDAETDVHIVFLGGVASSGRVADAFASWGMAHAVAGTREQDETFESGIARSGLATAAGPGFSIELRTAVAGPAQPADGSTRYRWFGVDQATLSVTGAMDLRWTDPIGASGQANVRLVEGAPPFTVLAEASPAGTGAHFWGEDYDAELRRVRLA